MLYLKAQSTFLISCREEAIIPANIQHQTRKYSSHNLNYKLVPKFRRTNFQISDEIAETIAKEDEYGISFKVNKIPISSMIANIENIKHT